MTVGMLKAGLKLKYMDIVTPKFKSLDDFGKIYEEASLPEPYVSVLCDIFQSFIL